MANETLVFDTMLKHQVKLERFKLWLINTFHSELDKLRTVIRGEVLDYDLERLTPAQFKRLRQRVMIAMENHAKLTKKELLRILAEFIEIEHGSLVRTWEAVSITLAEDEDEAGAVLFGLMPTGAELSASLRDEPVPALGESYSVLIDAFFVGAASRIYTTMGQAYLTKQSTRNLLETINGQAGGTGKRTGTVETIKRQMTALLDTVVQFIGVRANQAVQRATRLPWLPTDNLGDDPENRPTPPPGSNSGQGNRGSRTAPVGSRAYIWISVLDGRTTLYCRNQNGRIYIYGIGPIPPAHAHCRSTIMPYIFGQTTRLVTASEIDVSRPLSLADYGNTN